MLYLKINFGKEIHLLTKETNFAELIRFVRENFKNLPADFEIVYKDSDGDNISISSDEDVQTLYATTHEKFVKITILPVDGQRKQQSVPVAEVAPAPVEVLPAPVEVPKPQEKIPDPPVMDVRPPPPPQEPVVEQKTQISPEKVCQKAPEPVPEVQEEVKTDLKEVKEEPKVPEKEIRQESPKCPQFFMPPPPPPPAHHFPPQMPGFGLPRFPGFGPGGMFPSFHPPQANQGQEGQHAPFPGMEFLMQKFDRMMTQKIESMLPCIINKVKLSLQGKEQPEEPVPPTVSVHNHVRCDGCGMFPIAGIRYKCYECPDFDFCEKCEATVEHPHNFIKIKKPAQWNGCTRNQFNHHKGEGRKWHHGGMWAMFGCGPKKAFKLSKRFGGDPQIYREFIEKHSDARGHELVNLWAQEHNIKLEESKLTEDKITRRCQKLAYTFRKPAAEFQEIVKNNPDKKFWQVAKLVSESIKSEAPVDEKKVEEPSKVEIKVPAPVVRQIKDEDLTSSELTIKIVPKKEEEVEVIEVPVQPKVEPKVEPKIEPKVEPKVEVKAEPKVEPKIEAPKVEPPKPARRDFDLKDPQYNAKKAIQRELRDICGEENDYIDFVNKNFKSGAALCLNLWFEQH